MKEVRYMVQVIVVAALLMTGVGCSVSQQTAGEREAAKMAEVKSLIDSKNFVFTAQTANPTGGRQIQLTNEYDVRVSPDTVITFLPYFGRAFVAPINPTEGGIMIRTTDFDYNTVNRRKGGWDVLITPEDAKDVRQLSFNITETGMATLQVLSNNRQPITFTGRVSSKGNRR